MGQAWTTPADMSEQQLHDAVRWLGNPLHLHSSKYDNNLTESIELCDRMLDYRTSPAQHKRFEKIRTVLNAFHQARTVPTYLADFGYVRTPAPELTSLRVVNRELVWLETHDNQLCPDFLERFKAVKQWLLDNNDRSKIMRDLYKRIQVMEKEMT